MGSTRNGYRKVKCRFSRLRGTQPRYINSATTRGAFPNILSWPEAGRHRETVKTNTCSLSIHRLSTTNLLSKWGTWEVTGFEIVTQNIAHSSVMSSRTKETANPCQRRQWVGNTLAILIRVRDYCGGLRYSLIAFTAPSNLLASIKISDPCPLIPISEKALLLSAIPSPSSFVYS
jgi:hypothetical protein